MNRVPPDLPAKSHERTAKPVSKVSFPIRVAVFDTSQTYAAELEAFLLGEGYAARLFKDSRALMHALSEASLDVIILEMQLGGENALDVLRRVRSVSTIPCIALSRLSSEVDRVVSLEIGADHYLSKDLSFRELFAHIRALLRRSAVVSASFPRTGAWQILAEQRELLKPDGLPCGLTSAEFDVLQTLVAGAGQSISRDAISTNVFGRPFRVGDRTIDMLVTRLRRKMEPDPDYPRMIKTVRGVGYSFAGFLIESWE